MTVSEHEATLDTVIMTKTRDGHFAVILGFAFSNVSRTYTFSGVQTPWFAALTDVVGRGVLSLRATNSCRVKVSDLGELMEIGRADGSAWMVLSVPTTAPETTDDGGKWEGWTPAGARALAYLNKQRALRGRRDLDPIAAGYSDDDIIADALHYRWPG